MNGHFLTQVFNPYPAKIGYFKTNTLILTRYLFFTLLILSSLSSFSQGNIEFIENKGQWDPRVRFKGDVSNGAFFITEKGFTVLQYNPVDYANIGRKLHGMTTDGSPVAKDGKMIVRSHAYDVNFIGASQNMKLIADKALPTYNNYFIGNEPSKWASNCKIFQGITMKDVYPNIDVRYYTDNGYLKYDIVVKPGGNVSDIALKYDGVDKLEVRNKGLVVSTSIGELKESAPYTYQADASGQRDISSKYIVKDNVLRFDVKNYDKNSTLVIDPVVIFCSFSGSTSDNWGFTATYGPDGSLFGGGIVFENGFPASPGAFQTSFQNGETDISIIKLSPNGSNRVYATYIGGNGSEQPHSLIVDNQGNLVIAGRTNSGNYPVVSNGTAGSSGYDIVVTKLNATGTALIGSRKIGGSGDDGVNITDNRSLTSLQRNYGDDGRSEVILDAAGNVYVASSSQSDNFPNTTGFAQPNRIGAQDAVVLKLSPDLSSIIFATYLGGSANDAGYVLSLAPNGNIFVAGGTESTNFLQGTHTGTIGQTLQGPIDGYVAVLSNDGRTIVNSTYIGTNGIDQVFGVQFDKNGFPYIMGQTTGTWPIINATYSNSGGKQFIAKLQPDLSNYVYSTAFGSGASTPNISPIAFLVDRCENVYISGWGGFFGNNNTFNTAGTNGLPVTPDAIKGTTDGKDMYFFVLKKDAAALLFASFFGENNPANAGSDHVDGGTSRFDANGVIYQAICGNCKLTPPPWPVFPVTPGAWSTVNNASGGGGCNLTMVKIAMNLAGVGSAVQSAINGVPRDTAGCVPLTVDFRDTILNAQSYEWNFGDGSPTVTTTTANTSHIFNAVGVYRVRLIAIDPNTCNVRDTSYVNIRVGDLQASIDFAPFKLPPCDQYKYRFDNLSVPPPSKPFGAQSFIWDFGDNTPRVRTGGGPVFHDFATPGTYKIRLILVDESYCNAPDSIEKTLSVARNVVAGFKTPSTGCVVYNATFDNTTDAGQTYLWDFGDGFQSTDFEPVHAYTTPGRYHIKLIAFNPNTCNGKDSAEFDIEVFSAPTPDFSYAPNPPLENTPTTFTNLSSPDAVKFKWKFGDGDSLVTTSRAPVQHQYNATGTFDACLTAYNAANCDSTICRQVRSTIVPVVDVPNAFTPNSGDENSIIMVRGFGIGRMTFTIWNRWGQKVFETNNRFQGWDGKVKGVVQPMDVYAYTLNIEFTDGTKTSKKGDITLIR